MKIYDVEVLDSLDAGAEGDWAALLRGRARVVRGEGPNDLYGACIEIREPDHRVEIVLTISELEELVDQATNLALDDALRTAARTLAATVGPDAGGVVAQYIETEAFGPYFEIEADHSSNTRGTEEWCDCGVEEECE